MPLYIEKAGFGRVTPMPDTLTHSQTTEYSATQLLYSIQFKLSHAIEMIFRWACFVIYAKHTKMLQIDFE